MNARCLMIWLAVLPACLEVKDGPPPMCNTTADCDPGEMCEEHVCWGNPPPGSFAAVVTPPSQRADLVSREVLMLPIADNGWIDDIHLDTAVAFKGRMTALCDATMPCSGSAISASLTLSRPSVFSGGPGFHKRVDVADGTFELNVPATQPDDDPFTITVVPADRDQPGSGSLAQAVPPLQVQIRIPESTSNYVLELGGLNLPKVSGAIQTVAGTGVAGYRVVAYGRWSLDQTPTEVSTVDFTGSDGLYTIKLSRGLIGPIEIVARPFTAPLRPELHLTGLASAEDSSNKVLTMPPSAGELDVEVIVDHKGASGEIVRIGGAKVMLASSVVTSGAITRFSAEGTTNGDGVAHLKLPNTPLLSPYYRLSITPPPGSRAAAVFEKPYLIQASSTHRLGTRIAITGKVLGADGQPLQDVAVTARPSVRFLWSLEPGPQSFLGAIPAETVATTASGDFVLFVDHALANVGTLAATVWGRYDLTFEPTAKLRMPIWTRLDLELPRDDAQSTLDLGQVALPDAAYVRGYVYDDENARVEGAEVKLYRVQTDAGLCQDTRFEPLSCPIPPLLLGRAASEDDGIARLTLPR